ncbi:DNA methyltransferase [Bradyrhizobium sp. G127]|uniref:site-specific DNA-methyltransferase n=1 Tax=Bradyrhizobium sp. G127 TaxID=2904800 RepID=UPI001F18C191|nr:DNA methyltransferase [Bradyrhizobium sp. G127]MCF2524895.1 site-specific DNA-methyltransferase [Bradyrhizobium sp. G127]
MRTPTVETALLSSLRRSTRNARTHSKKQILQIADSIRTFGWTQPILADDNGNVIAGHGRMAAALELKLKAVPVIYCTGLTESQKRALALADNKIATNAGWDRTLLAIELGELTALLTELNLDLHITGFEPAEIDSLLSDQVDSEMEPDDIIPAIETTAVSRPDDIWTLSKHRLLCGDSREPGHIKKLMGNARAAMVFADPPYNVRVSSVQGRGKIKHREFASASGEMSHAQFTEFLTQWMLLAARYSEDGAIVFCCMDWRHLAECLAAGEQAFTALKNIIAWVKSNAGQGSFYRSQHELILVFKNGDAPHQNNIELGKYGRARSNVWQYAGVNSFRKDRLAELTVHPTVKPVALVADAMRDCSRRGDIVLDPFMGSGTTILAAEKVGRRAYGIEIDPLYVDVAIRRWQEFTKRDAILVATGHTFDEVAAERSTSPALKRVSI